jgi:hypothetical protein
MVAAKGVHFLLLALLEVFKADGSGSNRLLGSFHGGAVEDSSLILQPLGKSGRLMRLLGLRR